MYYRVVCSMLFFLMICDWRAQELFTAPLAPVTSEAKEWVERQEGWSEEVGERTLYSAKWTDGRGGVRMEFSRDPIHYVSYDGTLGRISPIPKAYEDNQVFQADEQPFPFTLFSNGHFAIDNSEEMTWFHTSALFGKETKGAFEVIAEDRFVLRDLIPGVDKEFAFGRNSMKTTYILHSHSDGDGTITDELRLPAGASLRAQQGRGSERDGWWYGNLEVVNSGQHVISSLWGTWCVDANRDMLSCGYRWKQEGNTVLLETRIDPAWLEAASYPVFIDPLVTGPTAAYGDQNMPSCFIPQFNVDSILVTIPGGITITDFFVTSSFYADPFTTAIMADGSMHFSTSCDSSQWFEVQPPNGDLPGTAYLELFDLRNPLLCCFTPICEDTTFYLRMHLGRYTPEGDCNQSYIYYTPFTQWPFTAYIEGHTVESYGPKWTVPNTDQCSNDCVFEGKARIKYGVPPYTLTHPWMEGSVVVGEAQPCDLGNTIVDLPLTWPNCPQYCPEPFDLSVPPPMVLDACNNSIFDMEADDLSVRPAPSIEDPSPVVVCSGSGETLSFESCAPFEEIAWFGNGTSGYGEVPLDIENSGEDELEIPFSAFVVWNGCESDTMYFDVQVEPAPDATFDYAPVPVIQSTPATLTSGPGLAADLIVSWYWTADGVSPQVGSQVNYVFNDLETHIICLEVTTASDCVAEVCEEITPVAAAIEAPNIITPNGDHLNDFLVFPNLEFFPSNHLDVWNRWGNLVLSRDNYSNDWDGGDLPGGTYYYILNVELLGEQSGYFMIQK